MSININDVAITAFDGMPKQAFQENGFKLRGTVRTVTNVVGNTQKFKKSAVSIARQKAIQAEMTPANVDYSEVTATLSGWYDSDYSDIFSQTNVNFDERRLLAETLGKSIGRRADEIIIGALSGSGTTNTIAAAGAGFTFAKFLTMNKFFTTNNARMPGQMHILINAVAEEDILNEEKFTSRDYTANRIMDNGSTLDGLNLWGYTWHVMGTMAEGGVPVAGSTYSAYAWNEPSVGLAVGKDFQTNVTYEHKNLSFLVSAVYKAGAVAIDPVGIVEIDYV